MDSAPFAVHKTLAEYTSETGVPTSVLPFPLFLTLPDPHDFLLDVDDAEEDAVPRAGFDGVRDRAELAEELVGSEVDGVGDLGGVAVAVVCVEGWW